MVMLQISVHEFWRGSGKFWRGFSPQLVWNFARTVVSICQFGIQIIWKLQANTRIRQQKNKTSKLETLARKNKVQG